MRWNPALAYERRDALAPYVAPIEIPADPNGLAYDRERDTLYVTDGETGAVLAVKHGRHRRVATIDAGGGVASNRLGGLAVAPDGTLYVARLGHGHAGAVFQVPACVPGSARGAPVALAGLSPTWWRLGVAHDAEENALYATQYHKLATGPCDGSIVRIDLATGQVAIALDGLTKPVGVTKLGPTLVVTDGKRRSVYRAELAGGRVRSCTTLATGVDRPDSVAACGPDSVVITTFDADTRRGGVRRLWLDGRSELVAQGDWEPRGIATDGKRAFVASRRAGRILVFPI